MLRIRARIVCSSIGALLLLVALPAAAQIAGVWSGEYAMPGSPPGSLRIAIASVAHGALLARVDADSHSRATVASIVNGELRCSFEAAGTKIEFAGRPDSGEIVGALRAADGRIGSALLTRRAGPDAAGVDVTGVWSGSLSGTTPCPGGGSVTGTRYSIVLYLFQSGDTFTGAGILNGLHDPCVPTKGDETIDFPIAGTVSGSTFTAVASGPDANGSVTGSISGSTMSINAAAGSGEAYSGTLTRTSELAPDTSLSGTYTGTYNQTITPSVYGCTNLSGTITGSGAFTATILQMGPTLFGFLSGQQMPAVDGDPNACSPTSCVCTVTKRDGSGTLEAYLNGSSFSGVICGDGRCGDPVTGTITSTSISGTTGGNSGNASVVTFSATRTSATGVPVVTGFGASPSSIATGQSSTLSWTAVNAASVTIDNGIGVEPATGSVVVSPKQTTTYTLTAANAAGSSKVTATVSVTAGTPQVVVSAMPQGMIELPGAETGVDHFTLTNTGTANAAIALSITGDFFSISQTSLTLAPNASQVIVLRAGPRAAGNYSGSVTVLLGGTPQTTVPVSLLVAAPPAGSVTPQPVAARVDVAAPAGQNPTGSVQFRNDGTATLQGIAVSDAPWIVPQSGVITIAPGATVTVSFTIDRSKRPDGNTPIGGLSGQISLVYVTGTGTASAATAEAIALATVPVSSVSVNVVDVVKPNVAAGTPPPLAPGELALFVSGLLSNPGRVSGDLMLSSRSGLPSINDLKLYFNAGQQVASVPLFPPNLGISFPAVMRNVFGAQSGSLLQLRSSDAASLSVAGMRTSMVSNRTQQVTNAVPVFRSDRGIGPGAKLLLTGLDRPAPATMSALVYVADISGNAASFTLDFRDASGNSIESDPVTMAAYATGGGEAPAGASSVVVTNTGAAPSKLAPYVLLLDSVTNDSWTILDPTNAAGVAGDTIIVPLVTSSFASAQSQDIWISNASSSPVNVGVEVVNAGARHRLARKASVEAIDHAAKTSSVAPLAAAHTTLSPTNGYARLTAAAGSITAAARLTLSGLGGSFGTALPAVPAAAGLAVGQSKRFTGVDDASNASIAANRAGTYRSSLILIESGGQPATVRVTVRYTFASGTLTTARASASRDFTVGANQMSVIAEIAHAIIGADRESMADLRNMQVDVSVVSGAGKVLPFIESVDNGSSDLVVRAE